MGDRSGGQDMLRREYDRINAKWLNAHFRAGAGLAAFICLMEAVVYFALRWMGGMTASRSLYIGKYMLAPSGLNLLAVVAALWVKRSRLPLRAKIYTVSMALVFICCVTYTVHNIFPSLCMAFGVTIVLTTAYGDRVLTTMTAAGCILCKTLSDLLFHWDPEASSKLGTAEQNMDFTLSLVILAAVYVGCMVMISIEQDKNRISIQRELEKQHFQVEALTDSLTGVGNRQAFQQMMDTLAGEGPEPEYSMAILDLDNFKEVNDTQGHMQGDRYLRELGNVLQKTRLGAAYRFGGDEFCILFRSRTKSQLCEACQDIQHSFSEATLSRELEQVTISFGVAVHQPGVGPAELLRRADTALYQAKKARGSICFYQA